MIPLKNLDNKSFIDILTEARQNIHRFTSEWTDENYHDPGITLLELSSWLTEMQRYYLNRVTDQNYKSIFKLLGVNKEPNGYAQSVLKLNGLNKDLGLLKNMKFRAEEQVFETNELNYYVHNAITGVYTKTEEVKNVTHLNKQKGIVYHLFGEKITKGNECIFVLQSPLPVEKPINIYFDIKEDYPVAMNRIKPFLKSFDFSMFQSIENDDEIEILQDDTNGFREAGIMTIKLKTEHVRSVKYGIYGFAIKIRVNEDCWITPAEVDSIFLNAVNVYNQNTVAECEVFSEREYCINNELVYGNWYLQGSNDNAYWYDLDQEEHTYLEKEERAFIRMHTEYSYYRICMYDDLQLGSCIIGDGTGVSNCRIRFRAANVVFEKLTLQVAENIDGKYVWTDWKYTEDLLKETPKSRVFTYDYDEEEIVFGNHEYGMVPENLNENIRILKCIKSDFERGNVKKDNITEAYLKRYPEALKYTNVNDAKGGFRAIEISEMHDLVYKKFNTVTRAITLGDYESLLMNLSGYRITYCRALNNHIHENQVSLVAIPYNGQNRPKLCKKMKKEIRKFLEDYRLITTRIDIIDPIYVEVNLFVAIKVNNRNRFNKELLLQNLRKKLTPIDGYVINENYHIGEVPSKSELIRELLSDTEIINVDNISLEAIGLGVRKSENGDLILPGNAVIYANEISVKLTD